MLQDWFAQARREFERGFLGKGRPDVGSRRRDRLPSALAERAAPRDQLISQRQQRIEFRQSATPQARHAPYTLIFAVVIITMLIGLGFGINWAAHTEHGLLSMALGANSDADANDGANARPTAEAQPTTPPTVSPDDQRRTYVVQRGDTLTRIAQEYGTTVEALLEANKLDDPRLLSVGQELIIPPN